MRLQGEEHEKIVDAGKGVGHLGSLKALVEIEFLETKDGHEASWKDSQPTKK